ncbi:hypothetical protein AURDEDRAFT_186582 [Auricularia subglabra TFB-10046 SS5]|uniref:F-box domain-containing protein n=1 Tax=Auricularia subglabra (strain TFB-10046 / SS5) TaxID=717982 RepID=J0D2W8_AURST|nr:hypothetical protein AURDEDRAFT_186582 [Auricularia subglabra TFB-10046 SS5]
MFNVPAARWKALEDAVERICEDAMPFFDASPGTSASAAQHDLDQAIWNTVKKAYVRFARLRNAHFPAVRVPDEVLALIFSHLHTLALIGVSHVCTNWRHAALSNPSLWATLDSRPFRPAIIYHLMNRSQPLPLHLEICIRPSTALDLAYSTSNHMIRLESLTIHVDDQKTSRRRLDEHSDSESEHDRAFVAIPSVLLRPSPMLCRLTIWDPHRLLNRIAGSALFSQQVPALRYLEYHGDITVYPFLQELSAITHFSYSPVFLGRLQLDSVYRTLEVCRNLEHFSLHVPTNYTFPLLDLPEMPASIKHFEIHIHAEDADIPHFLPFYAPQHALLVIALHAEPYSAEGCQRFLTSVLGSMDLVAIHLEKARGSGVIGIACADRSGFQRFFCDFPMECPPPDIFFSTLTSMSMGDTFWTLNPPPPLPQLTALELHVSPLPERLGGVLMLPPARSGRSVLSCPSLQTLVLVGEESDEITDRSIHSSLVSAFIRTRLAFKGARLKRLVLKGVLLSDGIEEGYAALRDLVEDISSDGTPWTWVGARMARGLGVEDCSLPLRAGIFRGPAANCVTSWG